MILKIKKLDNSATIPEYKSSQASGMDLYSLYDSVIHPNGIQIVETGIAIELPKGYEGQVRPRSGLATKGITVMNTPGTIDNDYRGEIKVILINHANTSFFITRGDRIAQLVIAKTYKVDLEEVEELNETVRGEDGFGSTGK